MPRHYIRKTDRRPYSSDQLAEAISRIKSGELTTKRCAKRYGIPRSTLKDHIRGRRGNRVTVGGGGRSTALTSQQENDLANCIKTMSKNGFGLSRSEVLDVVQAYVKRNHIKTPFKNDKPGQDWWLGFKTRHDLSIIKPQPLEHGRKANTNPFVVNKFFELLEETINGSGLEGKPNLIWNCDETSFSHDPSQTKVIAGKGDKVGRHTAATGRENTSVLACVNAAGDKMPPFVIFKGKNLWDTWIPSTGDWPNTAYTASQNGWMTSELFLNWFTRVFVPNIGHERPVLLIFDGHSSHVTPELIKEAQSNDVIMLKLPAHTSHILQPLDVSCFRGLKARWDQRLVEWQRKNVGVRPGKVQFAQLLGTVWTDLSEENIRSGFKHTGIYDPDVDGVIRVNRAAISEDNFDDKDIRAYKLFQQRQRDGNAETDDPGSQNPGCTNPGSSNPSSTNPDSANPSTPTATPHINTPQDTAAPCTDNLPNTGVADSSTPHTAQSDTATNYSGLTPTGSRASFEELLLDTVKNQRVNVPTRRRKLASGAEVLTSKDIQARKETQAPPCPSPVPTTSGVIVSAKSKSAGRNKKRKKTPSLSSASSENEDPPVDDDTDEPSEDDEEPGRNCTKPIAIGDFILARFATKRSVRHYAGQITGRVVTIRNIYRLLYRYHSYLSQLSYSISFCSILIAMHN